MDIIKPCPWCGALPVKRERDLNSWNQSLTPDDVVYLSCDNVECPVQPELFDLDAPRTLEEAITIWNKRMWTDALERK